MAINPMETPTECPMEAELLPLLKFALLDSNPDI